MADIPIEPGLPAWAGRLVLALQRAFEALKTPTEPIGLYAVATAAMPPAANWKGRMLLNTTLGVLAVSDGVNWIRQDTGGAI